MSDPSEVKVRELVDDKSLNPWVPMADPLDLAVLGKLAEELGELSAAVARCMIQGIEEVEPVTGKPNRVWLAEEIADVQASATRAIMHFDLDPAAIIDRKHLKSIRLDRWHAMIDAGRASIKPKGEQDG